MKTYIGIDPGTRNLGWAVITNDEVFAGVHTGVYDMGKHIATPLDIALGTSNAFGQFGTAYKRMVMVVEQQMKRRYALVAQSMVSQFVEEFIVGCRDDWNEVYTVSPTKVKRHFGIPCTGNYAQNKRNAVDKVEQLIGRRVTDHEADAYLCALYQKHKDEGCGCEVAAILAKSKYKRKRQDSICPVHSNSSQPMAQPLQLEPQPTSSGSSACKTEESKPINSAENCTL